MLTRLLVSRLLVNIAYIKIWVHLTFVPVHLRKKVRRTSAPSAKSYSRALHRVFVKTQKASDSFDWAGFIASWFVTSPALTSHYT